MPASTDKMLNKNCSRCGNPLSCGRDVGKCWCSELPPLDAARIDPKSDCLCPACLNQMLLRESAHIPQKGTE